MPPFIIIICRNVFLIGVRWWVLHSATQVLNRYIQRSMSLRKRRVVPKGLISVFISQSGIIKTVGGLYFEKSVFASIRLHFNQIVLHLDYISHHSNANNFGENVYVKVAHRVPSIKFSFQVQNIVSLIKCLRFLFEAIDQDKGNCLQFIWNDIGLWSEKT